VQPDCPAIRQHLCGPLHELGGVVAHPHDRVRAKLFSVGAHQRVRLVTGRLANLAELVNGASRKRLERPDDPLADGGGPDHDKSGLVGPGAPAKRRACSGPFWFRQDATLIRGRRGLAGASEPSVAAGALRRGCWRPRVRRVTIEWSRASVRDGRWLLVLGRASLSC
jgi:hypothetical protein